MNDKKEVKHEIINYLCGSGDDLSEKFLNLLHSYGMGEVEGLLIKNKLLSLIDSAYDLNIIFEEEFRHYYNISRGFEDDLDIVLLKEYDGDYFKQPLSQRYIEDIFPFSEIRKYTEDEKYLELIAKQYPKSLKEACDTVIGMLDIEDIVSIKNSEKSAFRGDTHFALGLFMRNNFGINNGRASELLADFIKNSKMNFYLSDNVSGFLSEKLWEEIQKNFDDIIEAKLRKEEVSIDKLNSKIKSYYWKCEYEKVIETSDEILKSDSNNHRALTYKILSYYYLKDYDNVLNTLEYALDIYPEYSRFLNLKAHVLYDSGNDEDVFKYLDTNQDSISFLNKKLFFLIKIGKLDGAYDFFKSLDDSILLNGFKIQVLARNLAKEGEYVKAIECYNYFLKKLIKPYNNSLDFNFNDLMIIQWIKEEFINYNLDLKQFYFNDLYLSWIDKLRFKKLAEHCPECGKKLTPIVYREVETYDFPESLSEIIEEQLNLNTSTESEKDEIVKENRFNEFDPYNDIQRFYCRNCKKEYEMGINGVYMVDCENYLQEKYGLENIYELRYSVFENRVSKDELKHDYFHLDEIELNAFIDKLTEIGYFVEKEKDEYELLIKFK